VGGAMSDSGSTLAIISLAGLLLNSGDFGALTSVEGAVGEGGTSGTAFGSDDPGSGDTRQALKRAAFDNTRKSMIVLARFTVDVSPSLTRLSIE